MNIKHGFLLIVKPKGISSYGVIASIKKEYNISRVGHCGTLDPLADGLMVVALGETTKMLPYLDRSTKTYTATIELGKTSTTYDSEGEIRVYNDTKIPTHEEVISSFEHFTGSYEQVPPLYSALKLDGKKLYEYARSKQSIDLGIKRRNVCIQTLKGTYAYPHIQIETTVSSGTYIRSLAHDIGLFLGCGGYITHLTRTHINHLSYQQAQELHAPKIIYSLQDCLGFTLYDVNDTEYEHLYHGRNIRINADDNTYILRYNNQERGVIVVKNNRIDTAKIMRIDTSS